MEETRTIELHHDPERKSGDQRTIRMVHNPEFVPRRRSENRTIVLTHTPNRLHARMMREKGLDYVVQKPEFCPNHCTSDFDEIMVNGEPKWKCRSCGEVF